MANNQLLASDTFGSGSLDPGWAAFTGLSVSQIVTNLAECNVAGTTSGQVYTGIVWPSDHASEVTVQTLTTTNSTITLSVRIQAGAASGYLASFSKASTTVTCTIFRITAGATTQLAQTTSLANLVTGDVITFQAAGVGLAAYVNSKRVCFFYDTTYTGGAPGFNQAGVTNIANSQVSAWRGYNTIQQNGIWQKQGIVMVPVAVDLTQANAGSGLQCWNIFQDTNAQILSGTVWKTWIVSDWTNDAASAMYSAESLDGITWARSAGAVLASRTNGSVFKNGSTYYMYCQASGSSGTGNMLVYTSSDGTTWAAQTPSSVLSIGGVGAWDHLAFYNIISVGIIGSTWYGFYNGANGGAFSTGLATSTNGIDWVKVGTTPVISGVLVGSALVQVGSTWYMWGLTKKPVSGGSALDPFECVRYSSPDLTVWTFSANSLHNDQMFEGLNVLTGGVGPASIATVSNRAYLWTNSAQGDATNPQVGQLGLAIAPAPVSAVVKHLEDAIVRGATDSFTSGNGDLSANWTTPTGLTKLQIVAGPWVEGTATNVICGMAYTGVAAANDQYSEITLHTITSANYAQPAVRMATNAQTYYTCAVSSTPTTAQISKVVAGVTTNLITTYTSLAVANDVFRLVVIGNVISLYRNGFLICQAQDAANSITSGSPGIITFTPTTLTLAQVASWNGGTANILPGYSTGGLLLRGVG